MTESTFPHLDLHTRSAPVPLLDYQDLLGVDQEGNTLTKRKKNLVSSLCYLHGAIVVEVRSAVASRWGQRAGDGVVDEGC